MNVQIVVKWSFPTWLTMSLPKDKDHLTKTNKQNRHEKPSRELLIRANQEMSQLYRLLILSLVSLWRHQHSDTEPRHLFTRTDPNSSSLWTRFSWNHEVTMEVSKRGKQPTILPSYDAYELNQWPLWQNEPKGAVLVPILSQ